MSFTIDDAEDLIRLLREHPEWKARVRLEVLGEELISLPELVRQNGVATRELQEIVRQNGVAIRDLQEIVRQNSADIRDLQEIVRQNSTDIRLNTIAIQELVALSRIHEWRLTRMDGRLGDLRREVYEDRWISRFSGRFGTIVARSKLVTPRDLERFEDAAEAGTITPGEALAVRQADILIEGTHGAGSARRPVLLVVEVSSVIESNDVSRAFDRAATLQKLGYPAVPVVAGAFMDVTLRDAAVARGVEVLLRPDPPRRWNDDDPEPDD